MEKRNAHDFVVQHRTKKLPSFTVPPAVAVRRTRQRSFFTFCCSPVAQRFVFADAVNHGPGDVHSPKSVGMTVIVCPSSILILPAHRLVSKGSKEERMQASRSSIIPMLQLPLLSLGSAGFHRKQRRFTHHVEASDYAQHRPSPTPCLFQVACFVRTTIGWGSVSG